ncbi:MAG: hypothetical protein IBJ12_00825 [Sphingomonadaceae bacterium]|nr:hypothetical protein [Sphingomonadaceae bacterium]
MTDQDAMANHGGGKAAAVIDTNFEKIAATIDKVRLNLLEQIESSEKPVPFVGGLSDRLGSVSDRLRSTQGDDVVEYAKTQIERHPTLLTVAVAAVGAAAAQIAVAAVRKERRDPTPATPQTVDA